MTTSSPPASWTILARLGIALCAVVAARPAYADEATAAAHYRAGLQAYDLGRFEAAIHHFELAYEAEPAPEFLFNLAQAHRQLDHCPEALFFYRRYLARVPEAPGADEIRARIDALEPRCAEAPGPGPAPPPPAPPAPEPSAPPAPEPSAPRVWATLEGGLGLAQVGDLDVPAQPSFHLGVGYPVRIGPSTLRLGARAGLFTTPYDGGRATFAEIFGHVAWAYSVRDWIAARVEVGLGGLVLAGLGAGNPYTLGGAPTSGPLGALALRAALGVDVPFGEVLDLRVTPLALSYSPVPANFAPSIGRLLRFDVTIGLGVTL